MERRAKLTILLGYNGTGKTTCLESIIRASGRRCIIVTPHDMEWEGYPDNELSTREDYLFTGITRHIWQDAPHKGGESTIDKVQRLRDCIVVFDDCRAYLRSQTSPELVRLFISRRQRMIDIFAVGHGFTQVPPVFFTYASDYILFQTKDNITTRKNYIQDFEKMQEAQRQVNEAALKNPYYKLHIRV